jgi:hypothetical protein
MLSKKNCFPQPHLIITMVLSNLLDTNPININLNIYFFPFLPLNHNSDLCCWNNYYYQQNDKNCPHLGFCLCVFVFVHLTCAYFVTGNQAVKSAYK